MGCNCGRNRSVTHQVRFPDNTVRTYPSEIEAKTAATSSGGSYERIDR
ncbi:hypothetical protein GCM10007304_17750 [Rhodococcoides trifolii]|uniref:Uncharacterized protein n=1 Tax=Rhodococcoides trifolii TaxID=908250 RepID=A0A917CZF4_9NOCA|nr:hypothetical protein GCM10007304_17750 [Rhodococcus trifolii]